MIYYNQNKRKGNEYMTTNSKNSRMKYRGYNNRRIYQMDLNIKREKREIDRGFSRAAKASSNLLVFLIQNIILHFVHKNREAEKKEQAIERKIVRERQRIKKQASYNEKKKKEQEERNELIDQWFKHMGKCINGEFVTIGLDEYTKMTDKQRREWNGEG